jgi:hypothetical protein
MTPEELLDQLTQLGDEPGNQALIAETQDVADQLVARSLATLIAEEAGDTAEQIKHAMKGVELMTGLGRDELERALITVLGLTANLLRAQAMSIVAGMGEDD